MFSYAFIIQKNTSALLLKSTMNFSEFLSKGMICDFFFLLWLKRFKNLKI